jgi:hypothetical protein
MFKIFSRPQPIKREPSVVRTYTKEVLEIHHEFETASEKLLEQANRIINSYPVVNDTKIEALKMLGFKQVKEVQESTKISEATALSKDQIESVNYYRQHYPYNKFIVESQVQAICFKYNLVCGDVDRFKGFVPEKNINEIVAFKLKKCDTYVKGYLWGSGNITSVNPVEHLISLKLYESLLKTKDIRGIGSGDLNKDDNWCSGSSIGSEHSYFDRITKLKLQICAPVKDMDISGLELIEGYKLKKKFIPDPVVLQPVKGGYLILTAWGDEASDPLVVNENFN